jgi:hypothetical protein
LFVIALSGPLVAFLISTLAVHCVEGCFGWLSYRVSAGA